MQILDCITIKYMDKNGGGTRYPDLNGVTVLDWIERGSRLVQYLDCDESAAQAIVDANIEFNTRLATADAVKDFAWQATRTQRDALLADSIGIRDRHRDERELVAANLREATTLTEEQFLQLLTYIDALRQIPQGYAYPKAVVWPETPEFI